MIYWITVIGFTLFLLLMAIILAIPIILIIWWLRIRKIRRNIPKVIKEVKEKIENADEKRRIRDSGLRTRGRTEEVESRVIGTQKPVSQDGGQIGQGSRVDWEYID